MFSPGQAFMPRLALSSSPGTIPDTKCGASWNTVLSLAITISDITGISGWIRAGPLIARSAGLTKHAAPRMAALAFIIGSPFGAFLVSLMIGPVAPLTGCKSDIHGERFLRL